MKNKNSRPGDAVELHRRAEKKAKAEEAKSRETLSPHEIRQTLHKLRVHQIELEMQNEELRRAQEALEALRARYFDLYDLAPVGYFMLSEQGLILEANLTAATLLGEARGTLVKQPISRFIFKEDQDIYYRYRKQLLETGEPQAYELRLVKEDGTAFWAHLEATAAQDAEGAPVYRVALSDIMERRKAEDALRESEKKYRLLIDTANESVFVAQDDLLKFFNPMMLNLMGGYSKQELMERPFPEFVHPDDRSIVVENHRRRIANEAVVPRYSFRVVTRDGLVKWVEINAALIEWQGKPATLNFLTDITERKQAEEAVQASLQEKEILLREIHHRVKNNMQVISSLFNLQSGHIKDEDARRMLKEGQNRIRSMALVHEKLYQARDLSEIEFAGYLQSLTDHLFHVFKADADLIRLETDLEVAPLSINSAVPCGLIVNELISNALQHAFPAGRKGVVAIRLRRKKDGTVELRVADDGVGFPEAVDFRSTESLGMQIVNLLVGQLEGTIELDRKKGTAFTIVFRESEKKART